MKPPPMERNPWWVVFGSTLALTVSAGPLVMTTLGLFIKPITQEFGWGRTAVTGAFGAAALGMAIGLPVLGRALDRYGLRRVAIPGVILFSVAVFCISIAPGSIPVFFLIFAIQGFFGSMANTLPHMKAIAAWFDYKRGIATGLAACGIGIGGIILPMYAQGLISSFGWRAGYSGLGLASLLIAVPSMLFFLRVRAAETVPASTVKSADEASSTRQGKSLPGITFQQAVRGKALWIVLVTTILVGTAVNGIQVHAVPILTDQGLDSASAAGLLALVGAASMAGRIVGGLLLDRFHAPVIASVTFLLPVAAVCLLASNTAPAVAMVLLGFAVGVESDLLAYLVSRYFGLKAYGQIFGIVLALFTLGSALGPQVLSATFDTFGSYTPALPWLGASLLVAAAAIPALGAYVYPPAKDQQLEEAVTP